MARIPMQTQPEPEHIATLRDNLMKLMQKEDVAPALEAARTLESLDADEPHWPRVQGDLLRRSGRDAIRAASSYVRATQLYAARGDAGRAASMARTLLLVDPMRLDVLSSVDPCEAKRLSKMYSGSFASM